MIFSVRNILCEKSRIFETQNKIYLQTYICMEYLSNVRFTKKEKRQREKEKSSFKESTKIISR